jgi:acetyl esterase/lipase
MTNCCFRLALTFLGLFAALLLLGASCSAREGDNQGDEKLYKVDVKSDFPYYTAKKAHKVKHKLDLYLPQGKKNFPVVMFVHGGAWILGDKKFFGVHEAVGEMFAKHGIGGVVINYRLSPQVKHPEHIKDVARAFAWVRKNIKKYGGRPDQIFLCGHSAGGHLAALLATDDRYLKGEGLTLNNIKGVMAISGVYTIPSGMFTESFGRDPKVHREASPVNQIRPGCPPFLIIYADRDYPWCDAASKSFCKALKGKKVAAETLEIKRRNHIDVLTRIKRAGDPCARTMLDFVAKHSRAN